MPVSQSPDSLPLSANSVLSAVDEGAALETVMEVTADDRGIGSQQPHPSQTMASDSLPPSSSTSSQTDRIKNHVVNPYIKDISIRSDSNVNPVLKKRQKIAEKYRLQALEHGRGRKNVRSCSQRVVCGAAAAVPSISALDLVHSSQQFRRSWRQMSCKSSENQLLCSKLGDGMPLRPRLFLFRRHERAGNQSQSQSLDCSNQGDNRVFEEADRHLPQHQQRQYEGIWELGTGITELSGEGGSGKTQICLSLCTTCSMTPLLYPNENESTHSPDHQEVGNDHYTAIYVTIGEGIPPAKIAKRLEQMVKARLRRDDPTEIKRFLSRIMLKSIPNEEEFVEFVEDELPNLLESSVGHEQRCHSQQKQLTKIGLVAFDGIAGFFRFSDPLFQRSMNPMFHVQRSSKFLQISSQLRKVSDVYDVPILITNQVTASIPSDDSPFSTASPGEQVVPALGLAWSNCVTTRYILQRKDGMVASVTDENVSSQNSLSSTDEKKMKQGKMVIRKRKARVLQSVNMPEEREIWYAIGTGDVVAM